MIDFTKPREDLGIGSVHAQFEVTDILDLPELSATSYIMRHTPTGARAQWIACADNNKTFAIAFKTPPATDKGIFHILEHSVLCGSERFPVKEPFVNLLKTSMQTFLNALTFSDKTMYPVGSTNTADLENLMDVYLDAVLHPNIYTRPRIFEQEGWHYEIADDGSLVYNGVVFNEMKGATSDPDDVLVTTIDRQLFPDTCYRFDSGGDPAAIPTLSYEEFLDNHRRHYDLSNSYIILYGDMDIERELAFIDKRLEGAVHRTDEPANPLELQKPVVSPYTLKEMATAKENASVALSYVIGTAADRERVLATDILLDALAGSNEAPLKSRVLAADLADDFIATILDGELQPRIVLQLKGAHEGVADQFRTLVEDTCKDFVENGIDHITLQASIAQAEFNLREQDSGHYPFGITASMYAMSSWLYDDGRPCDYLRFNEAIDHMKEGLDTGYFERLLDELVLKSDHWCEVELKPCDQGSAQEQAQELADKLASLTDEEIEDIKREVEALRAEQEAPDAPEDLAKLPQLKVSDIDEAPEEPEMHVLNEHLRELYHDIDAKHIDYVFHYFDLRHLAFEDLPYVSILCELLGKLPTKRHTAAELDTLIELNLGTLDFFCDTQGKDDDLTFAFPQLVCGVSALAENVEKAAQIPSEVWSETLFDDTDRILAILTQRRIGLEQHFVNAGHASAVARLTSNWSAALKVTGALAGIDFYLFLKDLLNDYENRKDALVAKLEDISAKVFNATNVTVSFTGTAEERERFWAEGKDLGLKEAKTSELKLDVPMADPVNEAFVIPSNVCFTAAGCAPFESDAGNLGVWNVAQRLISYDYLWNEVRVKGGAYGTGERRTQSGILTFWSYRDPGIDGTLERYGRAGDWLAAWEASEAEMDGYVVSTVANHDAPVKPSARARRQDTLFFSNRDASWRNEVRSQELACTEDDLRALSDTLKHLAANHYVCVFGPREIIEASNVTFDRVCDLLG